MFGRLQRPETDAIEVIIGPRASFAGDLRSDTSIRIDGVVVMGWSIAGDWKRP
jgi:cytoskeletal protein CcmA (bactofilin family)